MGVSVIGKERRIYSCDVCNKELTLSSLDELDIFVRSFWGQKKIMVCGSCGKPFLKLLKELKVVRGVGR